MNSLGFSQYLAGNQESEPILPICPLFKITHGFYVRLGDVSRPVFPSEWGSAFSRYWMSFRLLWTYPPVLFWTPRWPVDVMRPSCSRRAKTYRSEKPKCFIVDADRKLWGKSERQNRVSYLTYAITYVVLACPRRTKRAILEWAIDKSICATALTGLRPPGMICVIWLNSFSWISG